MHREDFERELWETISRSLKAMAAAIDKYVKTLSDPGK